MTRRFNLFLLAALLLLGMPYYWLLLDNRPGDAVVKPVTIAQLRGLAASLPGPAPHRIRVEIVGWRRLPGTLFAAGSGLKRRVLAKMVFALDVDGKGPIVIDSGLTPEEARRNGLEQYLPQRQAEADGAMRAASLILLTHEHPDHAGGLLALAARDPSVLARARFSPAQLPPAPLATKLAWPPAKAPAPSLSATAMQGVAPGVVVIPASGHTPGSQLIYVRLQDGREYLFAGDVCSLAIGCAEQRARSRLLSDYLGPLENRAEIYSWLRTIAALKASAPGLFIVPGHDSAALLDPVHPSGMVRGLTPPANTTFAERSR